jgi:hypothetical protein
MTAATALGESLDAMLGEAQRLRERARRLTKKAGTLERSARAILRRRKGTKQ